MRTIYAIPNYECDLNCPHCELHTKHIEYDENKFLDQLASFSKLNDIVILFGGEPTLYLDRFYKILNTNIISAISTNLLNVDADVLKKLSKFHLSTSWNKSRFTNEQYLTWIENLKYISLFTSNCMVLITMTPDLINDNMNNVLNVLSDIEKTNAVDSIMFEHLVFNDENVEFNEKCDEWLCKIHEKWSYSLINAIENKVNDWNYSCNDTYTLEPNGILRLHCPLYIEQHILDSCITCKYATICKPCKLHKCCTFPKNLYNYLSSK